MNLNITIDEIEFEKRKIQAHELGIDISNCVDIDNLESMINKELENGMKSLKNIIDEIDNIS